MKSSNQGQSWSAITSISKLPSHSIALLNKVNCSATTCIASGNYHLDGAPQYFEPLLIITSQDSGQSWRFVDAIAGLPDIKVANEPIANCTDDICIVAAANFMNHKFGPLLVVSQDKGVSWKYIKSINGLPVMHGEDVSFTAINCHDKTCLIVGSYKDKDNLSQALLLSSQDQGNTWTYEKNIQGLPATEDNSARLTAISCHDKNCVIGGELYPDSLISIEPLLLISTDHAQSWKRVENITGLPEELDGGIHAVNCTDDECVAIGSANTFTNNDTTPLVIVSKDNGTSWTSNVNITKLGDMKSSSLFSLVTE